MPKIFRCKTQEGYTMKILSELLQNNIKSACMCVKPKGVYFRTMDANKTILLDFVLFSNRFKIYKLSLPELNIGLNMSFYNKAMKQVKKTDSIELFIDDKDDTDFNIQIQSKDGARKGITTIKTQTIQSLEIPLPEGYNHSILVPSGDFQKMIKSVVNNSNLITIMVKGNKITFISNAGDIMKKSIEFGESDDDRDDRNRENSSDENEDAEDRDRDRDKDRGDINYDYKEDFDAKQIARLAKISALNTNSSIEIYAMKEKPLLFKTNIGSIGELSVFIKTKQQQEYESRTRENED